MVDSMLQVLSLVPREKATPPFWVNHPGIENYRVQIQVTLRRQCNEAMGIKRWSQKIFVLEKIRESGGIPILMQLRSDGSVG